MQDLITVELEQIVANWREGPCPDWPKCGLLLFRRITSEIPLGPRLVAEPGTYGADRISLNKHGAVSVLAVSAGGTTGWLGVKPGEFRWLEAGE